MKIWMVTEYILTEKEPYGNQNDIGFYSSKEKAIAAVYAYLRNDFEEEDIINCVTVENNNDSCGTYITTHCGEKYGMYDCYYEIESIELDQNFGE